MNGIPHWFKTQWALCLVKARYAGPYQLTGATQARRRDHWTYYAIHQGALAVRGFRYDLVIAAGQAALLPPYRHLDHRRVLPGPAVVGTVAGFDVETFPGAGNPLSRLGLPQVVPGVSRDWCARLEECFAKWKPVSDASGLQSRAWLDLLLLAYLDNGFRGNVFPVTAQSFVPEWVQALADRLSHESPHRALRPRHLHALSGFSRAHVNAEFKKYIGETPRRYLHRKRLQQAMQKLVSNPELSLAEVAAACGYSSQPLFNRHFRAATGQTPGQFRRAQHQRQR